jgi:hypothetical protein
MKAAQAALRRLRIKFAGQKQCVLPISEWF